MILTLTPNPSIDVTLDMSTTLVPGEVHRAEAVSRTAGGKGINVAHALHLTGRKTTALFPAAIDDPFLTLTAETGLHHDVVTTTDRVRTNFTVTEAGGRTTKINGPGAHLSTQEFQALMDLTTQHADKADMVVFAGSLPPGVPADFYVDLLKTLREQNPELPVAIDTSDEPIRVLAKNLAESAPTVIKPNGYELGQLLGIDGAELERSADAGDYTPVAQAARELVARGIDDVVVTLGAAGAVLATAAGIWQASAPATTVRSTVGAGDASLAGYLMGRADGDQPPERLRRAVAYGTAAAGLPGTTTPRPSDVDLISPKVTELT